MEVRRCTLMLQEWHPSPTPSSRWRYFSLPSPTSSPNTFALPTSPPSACHLLPPRSGWFVFYTHQRNCSHSFLLPPPDLPGCLLVSVETGELTGIALSMGLVVMHLYPTIRLMVAWLQFDHLLPELPVHTPACTSTNMGRKGTLLRPQGCDCAVSWQQLD